MCGRTACNLSPETICQQCSRQNADGKSITPQWFNNDSLKSINCSYFSSQNIAPGSFTPVLRLKELNEFPLKNVEINDHYIIEPMRWGLIPHWHKGDSFKNISYNMSNCRSDTMQSKSTFSVPLKTGKRCVVLMEGYYEWQEKNDITGKKQPFYIYPKLNLTEDKKLNTNEETERKLLKVAGLYDEWKYCKDGITEKLLSYSIITVDAHSDMIWLHHRMPAILLDDSEIDLWLTSNNVDDVIRPTNKLDFHPVSSYVGNSSNKGEECQLKIELKKPLQSGSSKLMENWLKRKPLKATEDVDEKKYKA